MSHNTVRSQYTPLHCTTGELTCWYAMDEYTGCDGGVGSDTDTGGLELLLRAVLLDEEEAFGFLFSWSLRERASASSSSSCSLSSSWRLRLGVWVSLKRALLRYSWGSPPLSDSWESLHDQGRKHMEYTAASQDSSVARQYHSLT